MVSEGAQKRSAAQAPRDVKIGKTLDTSDDTARLTVIHSRASSELARVYVIDGRADAVAGIVASGGRLQTDVDTFITLKSLGMHYQAADVDDIYGEDDGVYADPADADDGGGAGGNAGNIENSLDHTDRVGAKTKPKELFSYVDDGVTIHVVEISRMTTAATLAIGETPAAPARTVVSYQPVDTLAPAAPDAHGAVLDDQIDALAADTDETPESVSVKAFIPVAKAYSHIHFGVWAGLGDADPKTGDQDYANLGIGFVQSIGEGMTDRLGIGTVTYNGDWVATVQRQNATAGEGAISFADGDAELVANFDTEEFTGTLTGLATLEGTLDGNGFSGMKATGIDHVDLDASGDFKGEFSGGIYGDKGEEAAGVFDFDGGEAGAFVGAFGGTNQE